MAGEGGKAIVSCRPWRRQRSGTIATLAGAECERINADTPLGAQLRQQVVRSKEGH